MDVLKLRVMTLKSRFDGGKYYNQTVATVLGIDPNYIINEYFTFSKISFVNDVLDSLGITEGFRIDKPGQDDVMRHAFYKHRISQMTDEERLIHFCTKKKSRITNAKLKLARHINDDKRIFSKKSLKSMNNHSNINLDYRTIDGRKLG